MAAKPPLKTNATVAQNSSLPKNTTSSTNNTVADPTDGYLLIPEDPSLYKDETNLTFSNFTTDYPNSNLAKLANNKQTPY
jgi:hypothetical protein